MLDNECFGLFVSLTTYISRWTPTYACKIRGFFQNCKQILEMDVKYVVKCAVVKFLS